MKLLRRQVAEGLAHHHHHRMEAVRIGHQPGETLKAAVRPKQRLELIRERKHRGRPQHGVAMGGEEDRVKRRHAILLRGPA